MDVRSEIVRKFAENLSATGSCEPNFVAHLCDLIRAGNGVSKEKLMLLVQEEAHDHH
jgi:hypothetical protein